MTPDVVIRALRNSFNDAEREFSNGRCFELYLFLREIWKEAECWYDGDHVVTVIDGVCYDIRGRIQKPAKATRLELERRIFKGAFRWAPKKGESNEDISRNA